MLLGNNMSSPRDMASPFIYTSMYVASDPKVLMTVTYDPWVGFTSCDGHDLDQHSTAMRSQLVLHLSLPTM